jgi:ubiquitin C-terminal hydrolase
MKAKIVILLIQLFNVLVILNLESKNISNKIITSSLIKVFKNLWLVLNHRIYSAKKFIEIINKNLNSNLNLKEFIQFLLNNIHKELENSKDNLIVKEDYKLSHDYNDNISNFQKFKNIYEQLNGSIISKEFVGYLGILDFCEHCYQDNKITFKTFETLSFHIDDIIKTIQNNCVRIYQCFKYYVRQENMKCNKCNLKKYTKYDLWYMPSTLIITLDYGNNTKAKLIYEEYLNLTQFVTYIKGSPYYYELVGIIVNLEKNQNGNHYISYCKNSNNCLWYKYDNDIVVRSSFIDVASHDQPSALFFSYVET